MVDFNSAGQFLGVAGDGIADLANPTSLQFGPDGRLYVAEQNGRINAFTIALTNGQYTATNHEVLKLTNGAGVVQSIMNHNDDGSLAPSIGNRQVTGILVTGTAAAPVIYISSSDPRIATNNDSNLDTNSGVLTRVTWTGTGWEAVDLIRGLPRSEENHSNNGMTLSPDGTKLYLAVGGNTNNGAPSGFFAYTGEYALSGTVLEIDLVAINNLPILTDPIGSQINGQAQPRQYVYNLPTLDDPNTPNNTNGVGENASGLDEVGPWGGRDGLNMAILPADAPLKIYADGFRNPYDLVWSQSGKLYTVDNGSNGGLGGNPLDTNGVPTDQSGLEATNTPNNGGVGNPEPLFSIQAGEYYGHPAPARANQNLPWTVYNNNGTPDTSLAVNSVPDLSALVPNGINIQPGFLIDPSKFTSNPARLLESGIRVPYNNPASPTLVNVGSSSNGLTEYTGNAFGGAINGALLVAQFNNTITLLNVNDAGTAIEPLIGPGTDGILGTADDEVIDADGVYTLISGLATPLDVTIGPNGSIWVAEIGGDFIKAFAPGESVASVDFDNDGILNVNDPFIRDASNGKAVTLFPGQTLVWDFDPNQDGNLPGPNGYGGGLTGVMINGSTDFEAFFVSESTLPDQLIKLDNVKFTTAAGGGTTVVEYVSNGDATGAANTGEYLFHTGFNLAPTIDTFTIKWTVINPLLTGPNQQIGGYIGTGDQSNYLKIVATANPAGEIQIVLENNNVVQSEVFLQANNLFTVPPNQQIFFELEINPTAGTATPTITYETGGGNTSTVTGAAINLSGTTVLNTILGNHSVQGQSTGLAVGLYASNVGQPPAPNGSFQAIFTDIEVTGAGDSSSTVLYRVNAGGPTIAAIDGGPNWLADTPFLVNPGSNSVASFAAVEPGATVAPGTPGTIFDTERWDAAGGSEMQYGFSVNPGLYEVRLFLGNGFGGTNDPGERVFDVSIEGQVLPNLNDVDLSGQFGHLVGAMLSNVVQVTDGTLNIEFLHGVQNPLVNGIEIIQLNTNNNNPAISIVGGPYTVGEQAGQVQISLLASQTIPSNETVTVTFQIIPGTASPQTDYTYTSPTATFNAATGVYTDTVTIAGNSSDVTFPINIIQDAIAETNEAFTVNITGVSPNAQLGATTSTMVTITDDDGGSGNGNVVVAINSGGPALTQNGINFVADSFFINGSAYTDGTSDTEQPVFNGTIYETERNAGTNLGSFGYSIPVASGNYTVELHFAEIYQTTPGTRVFDVSVEGQLVLDNFDILAQNGSNINQPIVFTVPNTVSPNTFGATNAIDIAFSTSVNRAKLSGVVIRSAATNPAATVSIAATTNPAEPNSNGLFTVNLSQAVPTNTVVAYSIGGTATAGSDYATLSGTVTIPANQLSATIPVSVLDDQLVEGSETVAVTLTGVTGSNAALGATTTATVNIADNDSQASGGKAVLAINATSNNVQISSFGDNSFQLTNTGTKNIAQVVIDVSNALYPDAVFDPFGQAGDNIAKPLTINTNGNTGVIAPSAASYIGTGGTAGYKGIQLLFNSAVNGGFNPGETLGFSVDMDPNSVAGTSKSPLDAGSSPSWDVGGISGAELIGSTFTVTFTDGTTATGQLQGVGNQGGSQGLASQDSPNLDVTLTVNGVGEGGVGTYTTGGPSVIINGPAGQTARVVLTKGFIQPVTPYAQFLANQLATLAAAEFPANNAVEFQTVDVVLTGANQNISNLFNFSNVANFNFAGENQLPLGFVASIIDPANNNLPLGSVSQPIYLEFAQANSASVSIAATTQASEPNSNGLFTVNLSQAVPTNTVVAYSVGGTATANGDYTALSGTVTIPANQLSATIPVSVLDDQLVEGSETVAVTLTGVTGSNAVLGTTNSATVTIADNDAPSTSLTVEAESISNVVSYRIETDSDASGGSMLSFLGGASDETGSATFTFTGATGTYNVVLGTFDENDGVATLQVAQNGTSIGSVLLNQNLGSNAATPATKVEKSVATGVTIANGDSFTVTGFENAGEHARFDFIRFEPAGTATPSPSPSPNPSTPSTLLWQAEAANTIVNYRTENIGAASGGQVLSFLGGANNENGSATFNFGDTTDELAGTYNIIIGTFDENDGVASFTVELNDFETGTTNQIGSVVLNANLGSNLANAQTKTSLTVATGIGLTSGDTLTVKGFENSLEHARLDFLQLVPVA
jgi:hypothetical protein